jgi:hypothetical protein
VNGLGRRLERLELVTEACRARELEDFTRSEIVRRYEADGVKLTPAEIESKTARAMALGEHLVALAASGLGLPAIARLVAAEHDLDPDRVAAIFAEIRSKYGR